MSRKSIRTSLVSAFASIFIAASLGAALPVSAAGSNLPAALSANGTPVVILEGYGSILTPTIGNGGSYGNGGVLVSPNGEYLYAQTYGEIWQVDLSTALGNRIALNGAPRRSVTNTDGTKGYVATEVNQQLQIETLDLVAGTISPDLIPLLGVSDMNAMTSGVVATKEVVYAYVSSLGVILTIDMASGVVSQTVVSTLIPNGVTSLAVSAEGSKLYAANEAEIWVFDTADMSIAPVKLLGTNLLPHTGGSVMKVYDNDLASSTNMGRIYIFDTQGKFQIIDAADGAIWGGSTLGSDPRAMDIRSNGDAAFSFGSNVVSYIDVSAGELITEEFPLVEDYSAAGSVGIVFDENITYGTCIYTSNNGDASLSAVSVDGADCGPFKNRLGSLPTLIEVNDNAVMTVSAPTPSSREEQWVGIGIFVDGVLDRVVKPPFAASIDLVWEDLSGLSVTVRTYNQAHLDAANLTRVDDVTFTTSYRHERTTALDYLGLEASQVAAGNYHSCALAYGSVYCWGENEAGQLGDGTLVDKKEATKVVAAGDFTNTGVTSIDAGGEHTCAIEFGKAYCWGSNVSSQLGSDTLTVTYVSVPTKVDAGSSGFENEDITAISSGDRHTCAVTDGSVYCWGGNSDGQLGTGTTDTATAPKQVSNVASVFTNTGVSQVSSGYEHTCVVSLGSMYCWGANSDGQLGNNTDTGTQTAVKVYDVDGVFANSNITNIAAGGDHTCAITGGSVYCWGYGEEGQLGNDNDNSEEAAVKVSDGDNGFVNSSVTHLTAGELHNCAVQGGSVYCWGYGDEGQLGDDNDNDRETPVKVENVAGVFTNSGTTNVSAGASHTCAISSGDAFCWGEGSSYRLGHGSTSDSEVAVKVCCGVESTNPSPPPTPAKAVTYNAVPKSVGPNQKFKPVKNAHGRTLKLKSSTAKVCRIVGQQIVFVAPGKCRVTVNQGSTTLKTINTKVVAGVKPKGSVSKTSTSNVFFAGNSAVLSSTAKADLRKLASRLKAADVVTVSGHAAYTGFFSSRSFAKTLSEKRAEATAKYLRSLGVKVAVEVAYGSSAQVSKTLSKNRRVEIAWL
jgi:alpha-tubulin suppressor-like RCC1 family protein/outer membrane protein OmpA-like peptidoglycan-associated protein